jgi:ferredoxin-NADP reductase
MDLERVPLSLMRVTEKQLRRNNSGSGLLNVNQRTEGSVSLTMQCHLPAKVGTSFAYRSGRTVSIARLRTENRGYRLYSLSQPHGRSEAERIR